MESRREAIRSLIKEKGIKEKGIKEKGIKTAEDAQEALKELFADTLEISPVRPGRSECPVQNAGHVPDRGAWSLPLTEGKSGLAVEGEQSFGLDEGEPGGSQTAQQINDLFVWHGVVG